MNDDFKEITESINNLKLRILSKMHINPKQKYGFSTFGSSFGEPLNYMASALGGLEIEGRVVIERKGGQAIISLTRSEVTSGVILDPAVQQLTKEIKDLNEREKQEKELSRKTKKERIESNKNSLSGRRKLVIVTPEGDRLEITNLSAFCKKYSLCAGSMYKVSYGKLASHKGFRME